MKVLDEGSRMKVLDNHSERWPLTQEDDKDECILCS